MLYVFFVCLISREERSSDIHSPWMKCFFLSEGSKSVGEGTAENQSDGSRLREYILKAKFARCRARFPIPVILYKGNYICRWAFCIIKKMIFRVILIFFYMAENSNILADWFLLEPQKKKDKKDKIHNDSKALILGVCVFIVTVHFPGSWKAYHQVRY